MTDIVQEARQWLARAGSSYYPSQAQQQVETLCAEVERLREQRNNSCAEGQRQYDQAVEATQRALLAEAEVERLRAAPCTCPGMVAVEERDQWREACQRISAATEAEVVLADIPADVQAILMQCATSNGRISYDYLCDVWRRGRASLAPLLQRAVDVLTQGACYTCGAEPGCNIDCPGCKWVADAEAARVSSGPFKGRVYERVRAGLRRRRDLETRR